MQQDTSSGRQNPSRRLNRSRIFGTLAAITLTAFPALGPGSAPRAAFAQYEVVIDPPLDPQDAATEWRWIGLVPEDPPLPPEYECPGADGWSARLLFDSEDGVPVPPGLRRFCLYEAIDPSADPLRLKSLLRQGELNDLARDHMAVGLQSDELKRAVWEELHQHFLDQAGAVALPQGSTTLPRLAFLDTAPTDEIRPEDGWTDSSPHGYTLINMAKELLCTTTTGGCVAQVVSRLTLAHKDLSPQRDPVHGGYIGTLGELAQAIRREVSDEWQAGAARPLILDLSLGWDGGLFGGGEQVVTAMPPDVQAVHDALRDAACRGVLVVAAAGNTGGGPEEVFGPLYPAAWEARRAPDFAACTGALEPGAVDPTLWPAGYWPLIYAAGGVQEEGEPLVTARDGGEPRLVAFADHGVAEDPRPGPTAVLAGSSVGAAVVSAAAAAVWHYRPGGKVHEIMEIVYQAGDDLGRGAGFCLGGAGCPFTVRRVSVCQTVHDACVRGGACPPLPACVTPQALDLSAIDLSLFLASADTFDLSAAAATATFPECEGNETVLYQEFPVDPCPHWQYYGLAVELWSNPQPGSNPCPSCLLEYEEGLTGNTGTLYLEIDSRFEGVLSDPTLIIDSYAYNLSTGLPLTAGSKLEVVHVPDPGSSPAFLAFTVGGDQSAISPLLVVDP